MKSSKDWDFILYSVSGHIAWIHSCNSTLPRRSIRHHIHNHRAAHDISTRSPATVFTRTGIGFHERASGSAPRLQNWTRRGVARGRPFRRGSRAALHHLRACWRRDTHLGRPSSRLSEPAFSSPECKGAIIKGPLYIYIYIIRRGEWEMPHHMVSSARGCLPPLSSGLAAPERL
jgi:hypothetical protein